VRVGTVVPTWCSAREGPWIAGRGTELAASFSSLDGRHVALKRALLGTDAQALARFEQALEREYRTPCCTKTRSPQTRPNSSHFSS